MLFTATVALKLNLQIDLIIILQFIKKNKYEKLVKRNGVMTFFLLILQNWWRHHMCSWN